VLVHVGVALVPGVVGVTHRHLGGGGQGHHGRGLDVLLHVGGQGVRARPLGRHGGRVGGAGHVGVWRHLPPGVRRGRGVVTPGGQIASMVTRPGRGRGTGLLPHWRAVLASGRGRSLVSSHSDWRSLPAVVCGRAARERLTQLGHRLAVAGPGLHQLLVLGSPILKPDLHLSLGQTQIYRQLRALWQPKVLGPLKSSLEMLDLEGGVDCSRLSHFLSLTIHPTNLAVLYGLF